MHLVPCNTFMELCKVNTTMRMTSQKIIQYSCTPQNMSKPSWASVVFIIKKYFKYVLNYLTLVMYLHSV